MGGYNSSKSKELCLTQWSSLENSPEFARTVMTVHAMPKSCRRRGVVWGERKDRCESVRCICPAVGNWGGEFRV